MAVGQTLKHFFLDDKNIQKPSIELLFCFFFQKALTAGCSAGFPRLEPWLKTKKGRAGRAGRSSDKTPLIW